MISNEGLAIEIKNLSVQIADLKAVIANQVADFVRKDLFELRMREMDVRISDTDLKIAEVRRSSAKANWKTHTLTALFTAILISVTIYVVNDIIGRR